MNYWENILMCNCNWMFVVIWSEADDNSAVSFVWISSIMTYIDNT